MSELTNKIKRNSVFVLFGKLITPLLGFLILAFIIKNLSVEDYGIYQILISFLSVVGLLSSFGIQNIFTRYIPEFQKLNQNWNIRRIVFSGMLIRLLISIIIIGIIHLFPVQIFTLFKISSTNNYFSLFSIFIILQLEFYLLRAVLTSLFLHQYLVYANIVFSLLRFGLVFIYLRFGWGLKGLILGEIISTLILVLICMGVYYYKYICNISNVKKTNLDFKRIFKYGIYNQLNEVGVHILSITTDIFIISAYLGPVAVGIYAFASRLVRLVTNILPHRMFEDLIKPSFFTKYAETKNDEELNKMFNLLMKIIAFTVIPTLGLLYILGDKIIVLLFDPEYLTSLPILRVIIIFFSLNALLVPIGLVLHAIEKVNIILYSKIFAVYNLVGDLLVIDSFGIIGVAIITSSAELFKHVFCFILAKKYVKLRLDRISIIKIVLNSIMPLFVVTFLSQYIVSIIGLIFTSIFTIKYTIRNI